jgi:hypothetical protein
MPSGATIFVPPQNNFTEVYWLMAPPPEHNRTSKEERIILSHSECKMRQEWPGVYKKWATNEYGGAVSLSNNRYLNYKDY